MSKLVAAALVAVLVVGPPLVLACESRCAFAPPSSRMADSPSPDEQCHPEGTGGPREDYGPTPSQSQHCCGHDAVVLAAPVPAKLVAHITTATTVWDNLKATLGAERLTTLGFLSLREPLILALAKPALLVLRI